MAGTKKTATAAAVEETELEGKNLNSEEKVAELKKEDESPAEAEESEESQVVDEEKEKVESKGDEEKGVDFKAKFYYLAAELDNIQKRNQREKDNLIKYGNEKILTDLISVVDNLERTIEALQNDEDEKVKNIVTGVEMIRGQFLDVLKKYGLTPVEALGKAFDPNFHEAISQKDVDGKEENEVLEEFQKGYVLNGRLLRASMVVVNNK